jgi:hypothetical protein
MKNQDDLFKEQLKKWTLFYRLNTHRFVEHYLGIELFLFQKILLYFMNLNTFFMLVAARGLSKSYMIAIFCVARCILYPNTKVVIASGVKKQAGLIITEKIKKELMQFPNVEREIKDIKTSVNECAVFFWNGSTIESVASTDNARGYRCNILILEEFRMIKKDILDTVLKPMLNVYRQPPYLKKDEYSHLTEENIELYISSAWFESHWMWQSMLSARKAMVEGKDKMIFAMDYLTSIHHGLLSKKRVQQDKESLDFDDLKFRMEYENLMYGQNANALYALEDIEKNRSLKNVLLPISNLDYQELKSKRKEKLKEGEIRILSVDVALIGGKNNDATIIKCFRLIPNGSHYIRKLAYVESFEGAHTDDQAIRIKQIFEDLQCSYVALDTHGNGMSIYDALVRVLYDEERDLEYEPWTCFNDDPTMKSRAKGKNPLPVIYSIKADQSFNHEIASSLRVNLQNGLIELPINELEAKEMLKDKNIYQNASVENKARMLQTFVQTTAMVNELVNLDHEIVGGKIKVKEKAGKRKDRYSAIAYGNQLAKILEQQNLSSEEWGSGFDDDLVYY